MTANSPCQPAGLIDPMLGTPTPHPAELGASVYRAHAVEAMRGVHVFGAYSRASAEPLGRPSVGQERRSGARRLD